MSQYLRQLAATYKDLALAPTQNYAKQLILDDLEILIKEEVDAIKASKIEETKPIEDEITF